MIKKNESGAALVIVLILLMTGSLLIGSLFVVAQNHINSAVREEGISKAFQNADAGVEFVKVNRSEIFDLELNQTKQYLVYNNELKFQDDKEFITGLKLGLDNSSLKFLLEAENDDGIYRFTSTGYSAINNKEFKKKIRFELGYQGGNLNNILNLEEISGTEIDFKGNTSALELGIATLSEEMSPSWDDWEEVKNQAVPLSSFDDQETFDKEIIEIDKKNNNKTTLENKMSFKNSIIFVDGDLDIPTQVSWENSIIVLKNELKFTGFKTHELKNSIFVVYDTQEVHFAGNMPDDISLDIDFSKLPQEFKTMEEYIPTLQVSNWDEN